MLKVVQNIFLDSLPSRNKLAELKKQGVHEIVNVSGVDFYDLYGLNELTDFALGQYTFRDVFSDKDLPASDEMAKNISASAYLAVSTADERMAFRLAVDQVVACLKDNKLFFLCCHQGIGRSPCVLFTAMISCYQQDYSNALKILKYLKPESVISTVSYSAANWFLAETK